MVDPPACANSGACVELAETFRCDCAAGYTGNTCGKKEHNIAVNFNLHVHAMRFNHAMVWICCEDHADANYLYVHVA